MISSRELGALVPHVKEMALEFLRRCEEEHGIIIVVTCTYRDNEAQNALYAQGRTKPGRKITWARGGYSWHQWRRALDVVPVRNGKPIWGTTGDDLALWRTVGEVGKSVGFEWAGDWRRSPEFPHFQLRDGFSLGDLIAGKDKLQPAVA